MALTKRKAWRYVESEAPPLASIFSGGIPGRQARRYWLKDNLVNGIDLAVHFFLRVVPLDACSDAGARIGRFAIPRFHKVAVTRGRATLLRILPDATEEQRQALLERNWEAQGRLMTEFSALARPDAAMARITVHDLDNLTDAAASGPVILVGMHLGNWEIGSLILKSAGIRPHINYTPPKGRAKAWISRRIRARAGVAFLPPGAQGTRFAVKVLKEGKLVSMFCDEGVSGKIRGPLFGRAPHQEGNLAVAVRLARLTGATICPWYNLRREGFSFDAFFLPPLMLPAQDKAGGGDLAADIARLNAVIEPVIRENLGQWYFLDNALPEG
jgi:Kdo2-lipid IVA lauroyltransferase/acyltransferase